MQLSPPGGGPSASVLGEIAAAVVDGRGTVLHWSRGAEALLGLTAAEVCGRPVGHLLADASERSGSGAGEPLPARAGRAVLRHRSGGAVEVVFQVVPWQDSSFLVLACPARSATDWEQGAALLRALLAQGRIGIGIHDTDLTVVRTNITSEVFGGPGLPVGGRLAEVMSPQDAEEAEAGLRRVLGSGVPLVGHEQRMRSPQVPGRRWSFSLSALRLEDAQRRPSGVAVLLADATASERARRELELRYQASVRIGASLDVRDTAQSLVDVLVPAFADLGSVDLAEAVLEGDEPPRSVGGGDLHMRRAAVASAAGPWPAPLVQPGEPNPPYPDHPVLRSYQRGETVIGDRAAYVEALGAPEVIRLVVPEDGRSAIAVALRARGLLLGSVDLWRTDRSAPFDRQDADLLAEIASRAALSVDNARRYTREHRAAVALQQRLLPPAATDAPAADTAGTYLPAGGGAEVSGDWYDVIPLPSLRAAFVVGDVIGHGLAATATMGRLRAAIQTLADLELDPGELLAHLDDLVARLASEADPEEQDAIGATCLYALYDPVTGRCTVASAGHPPPVVVPPEGPPRVLEELSPGPPLGVGGMPFEATTIELAPGTVLALYTDGLVEGADHDAAAGLRRLNDRLAAHCRPGRPLQEIGRAVLSRAGERPPRDDVALLLARTRVLPAGATAAWEFPADPAVVADAREVTARQLADWGLDDLAFTTELVVSELVTNAVRYAGGPVGLRLIRDHVLVCEVTDPSNTQPRLRRARWADEGGRGLFLVAQLTARWGSRYDRSGKTIWTEQALPGAAPLT
ncbi:SpoIIE family protein phosphatase [Kitasatospora cineracea]|uniref:protein-serine/threonine phosphatase n=1 Tax=Kitasatospora cineracea TaxID=88074 RepID=A0A3N4RTG0_9ACTN|nr:SpoIIE family protein phosphatase [Kitasatospora cineracea]RPE36156.1 PAS domain S-box-containing protein [Kitasatospora cineracea]